mgnify:CR=1 FL=1
MADNFIHLHLHSQFSNYGMKDAISSVDGIIKRVHELGQRGFALTDHNGCSGLIDTYVHLQKYNKKHQTDLKMVFGSELYYTYDVSIKDKSYSHILFLAKNQTGLENLFKLTTEAHKHYYYKSRIDLDLIKQYSEGLICTSACMGGWLKGDNRESLIPQFKDIFGDDLYFEIHTYQHEDQKRFNAMVADMSVKYDVPLIAACDSHYVYEEDYELHKAFRGRSKDDDEDQYYASNDFFIQSEAQVFDRLYPQFGVDMVETMVKNTNKIFDQCNTQIDFNLDVYPKFVKDGDVKPVFLQALRDGYKQKILNRVTPEFKKQVDERVLHEIDILEQVGYMDYLLITKDLLDACRKRGIPVSQVGRGSIGGCECAYLLDIVGLDAIKNNLYFERFANPNRVSPADVDNDCSQVRRAEVIEYLKEKYKYVYQCRTFSYMKASGALKEAARCLGIDKDIADAYSKKIKSVSFDDDEDFYDDELEHAKLDHVNDGKHNELFKLAKQLVGIMTGFGKHASAVIVSNQDITKYCSLEMQKDSKTKEETYVASTNFKHLESMGFLKEDILGLRTLDVIDDCVTIAGVKDTLDLINLPWNDEKTLELLRKGDTLGVFQMKSYGMTQVLKDIAPKSFVDLISVVALYRPACILGGTLQEFIDRRNGKPFEYLDPRLKDVLSETYGIMLYQEDIMKVVQVIGGYSMAEADTVRRAIGKKDHDLMQQITGEFIERAKSTGTDPEVAQQILDMIIAAGSYSFNHCISGDTVLYRDKGRHKPLTVAEMYKTMHDREWAKKNGHEHLNDKYRRYGYGKSLSMVDDRIKINDIVDIYYKGKNDVYLVETEKGSFVKATMKHKFPTPDGIKLLSELQVGDLLYTKGERAVVKDTYNLTDLERSDNLPTKGQRGFQRKAYSPTRNFEQSIEKAKQEQRPCELCGCGYGSTRFEMHHKDFNRKNNDLDNFQWLCVSCHKKEHYKHGRAKKGDHGYFINIDKIKSIMYVGIEDVYDVEMAHPNHTFVVNNGLVVCNSHSQSYGYMAYITAYLKAHYPLEFYVATINSEDGNQEKILPYIQEIKRKGIEILPPDLRHSKREWTVQGNSIRVGLSYIRGINKIEKPQEYTIDAIFSKYTKLQLEGLVGSGALDFLGDTNELMALIPEYKSYDGDRKNALAKIDEWKAKLMEHEKLMSQEFEHVTPKEQQSMEKKKVSIENKIQEWTDKYNSIVLIESPNLTCKTPVSTIRYKYLGCSFEDPLKGYNTNLANGRDVKAIICSKFERRTTKAGNPMANILDHNGNRYVMWSNYLVELECGKGYYIQVYGDTIRKVKPLELKQNTP